VLIKGSTGDSFMAKGQAENFRQLAREFRLNNRMRQGGADNGLARQFETLCEEIARLAERVEKLEAAAK
jgi:hypothetical protein